MSKKKREEERAWKARKENQQPHGKVKALIFFTCFPGALFFSLLLRHVFFNSFFSFLFLHVVRKKRRS
jgi:hypothetical protein